MTKKKLAILEKCFAAEVESAVSNRVSRLCQLRDSKAVRELVAEGMIQPGEQTIGGRFPMTITGYTLTLLGNMTYCTFCK